MNFEKGFDTNAGYDPERGEGVEDGRESEADLRTERELFQDHERLDGDDEKADALVKSIKDQLAEESDGIIYIPIPEYSYDTKGNPFLGMGPRTIRLYSIARYLDVTFLHRFMYGDILVCGVRSGEYVEPRRRGAFVEHIRDTGGLPIEAVDGRDFDFEALKFSPYVASDSTMALFELYHKSDAHAGDRPHYPVDTWLVYDSGSYESVGEGQIEKLARYRLCPAYDRSASLIAVAVIN